MSRRFLMLATMILVAAFAITACDSGDTASDAAGAYIVSAETGVGMIEAGDRLIIDVRTPAEFAEGHIVGARNYDVDDAAFAEQIAALDADQPLLVYCRSGNRSARAASEMEAAGVADIADAGGLADLAAAGAPVE